MWQKLLVIVFSFGFIKAQINPFRNEEICGRPTCENLDKAKFKYSNEIDHLYKYKVDVRSLFNGTSKNESTLFIESSVHLSFISSCEGIIALSDVVLKEGETVHPNSKEFAKDLGEFQLRFSFNDGIISELCPDSKEQTWVLNFKRGLLSLFYNSMKRFDLDHVKVEEDVKGICDTKYVVTGSAGTSLLIEKTKDLTSCLHRSKLHSMVQSVPYSFRSNARPEENLITSSSKCLVSIDHHVFNNVECTEKYLLKPFSNGDAGVTTTVVQTLTLVEETNSTYKEDLTEISRRTNLLFEHILDVKMTDNIANSKKILMKMCKLDEIGVKFSEAFTNFIQSLRHITPSALAQIFEQSSSACPKGRKYILDSLPYVNTEASLTLMKDLILNKNIQSSIIDEWMYLISFTERPDKDMLAVGSQLLQSANFNPSIFLSIATLTHTYCMQNSACAENPDIDLIVHHLENTVWSFYKNYTKEKNMHQNLMIALKSLGNTGIISSSFEKNMQGIIMDPEISMEVRLAAIECHRRVSCDEFRQFFVDLFKNIDNPIELRIAAYLQMMRCPNYILIQTIRNALMNEEVNQVGSFVWTHLNNILKSAVPSKVEIQGLLSDTDLVKKFNSDVRKFSHNYQGSIFFEEYNIGSSYESNVIFANSYVPSSGTFNLTVDMFGQSINLFEVYTRMEGFDSYLESLFGPNGPYSYDKYEDKIPKMRFARSVGNELSKQELDEMPNILPNKFEEPKMSIGFKIFGNDVKYSYYDGFKEIKAAADVLNPVYHLQKLLSGKDINFNKASMFLDTAYSIPSGAGLPLSLSAVGTYALNVKLFGSLDADNFATTKEFNIKVDIKPDVSVDFTGSLTVDAFFAKSGLKLKSSMFTSTALEGNLHVKGLKHVKLKLGVPRKISEIFNSRSELIVLKHNKEQIQKGLRDSTVGNSLCSWPLIDKTIGVKFCTMYYFVNVTKMENAPYFALSGPAGIRMFVEKLNPAAKDFIFEYNWRDKGDLTDISLEMYAPGSSFGKIIDANLTVVKDTGNLTLLIKSTSGTFLTRGKFKNTPNEKFAELSVNINEYSHLDVSMSLTKEVINHGYVYYPRFYLGINKNRVVEASGSIRNIGKKEVSQYEIDVKFQTKRMVSKVFGYYSQTQKTSAVKLRMMYKFLNMPEQGVDLGFSIEDRSKRNFLDYRGAANLQSTSYPTFDFDSKMKVLKGQGHTELGFNLTLNAKADLPQRTNFQLIFLDKSLDDGMQISHVAVALSKQSKNIDVKLDFKYQSKSPNTNVVLKIDYGENKRILVTTFIYLLRKPMDDFRLKINVDVPDFVPMVVKTEIRERAPSAYSINFDGTWFSGHKLTAQGFYQDKSTPHSFDHHIKLMIKSPSFDDILADVVFYRDDNKLKGNIKINHNKSDYIIFVKHVTISRFESTTEARLNYNDQIYSLSTKLSNDDHTHLTVELHIDQIRDIHLSTWLHNKQSYKAAGLEVKWDANRDPNQKLIISANVTKIESLNYEANFLASYPGRTFLGNLEFVMKRGSLKSLARFSWDDNQSFAVVLNTQYNFDKHMFVVASSELVTPFESWHHIYINTGFEHEANMYSLNSSLKWDGTNNVSFEFYENYTLGENLLELEYNTVLSSTLENIPSISAYINHQQNSTKLDTILKLKYEPEQVIDIKSKWKVNSDETMKNFTGTVVLFTPFEGFNKGYLVSKITLTKSRYLKGIAELEMDLKKITVNAEGKFKKLTNSLFTVNITTPIEKYKLINGKLGFSEENRYLVALITLPNKFLGAEILLQLTSLTNFDSKFILGTPLEFLQSIILVGKLKPEMADFRAGWNNLLAGFTGVWHYNNVFDFDYSYIIYTPIDDFEENSVILKLIMKEGLDTEMSAKLSSQKIGVKVQGQHKPVLLEQIGVKLGEIYGSRFNIAGANLSEKKEDEEQYSSWSGLVELDTIVYPTMKGDIEIEKKEHIIVAIAKLSVPDGTADISNEFAYYGPLSMANKLQISTPYSTYHQITSDYVLNVIPSQKYHFFLDLNYKNKTSAVKNGILAEYYVEQESEAKSHNVKLKAESPLVSFLNVDCGGMFEMKNKYYGTNFFLITKAANISMKGNFKGKITLDSNAELNAYMHALTNTISVPPMTLNIKRSKTNLDNDFELHYHIPDYFQKEVYLKLRWLFENLKQFSCFLDLDTPFSGLQNVALGIKHITTDGNLEGNVMLNLNPIEIEINHSYKNNIFHSIANLNLSGKSIPVVLKCNIIPNTLDSNKKELNGILKIQDKDYSINGNADLHNDFPMSVYIEVIPVDKSDRIILNYTFKKPTISTYELKGFLKNKIHYINVDGEISKEIEDWNAFTKVETSNELYKNFEFEAHTKTETNTRSITVEAKTPLAKFLNPKAMALIENNQDGSRNVRANFDAHPKSGNLEVYWIWEYLQNMKFNYDGLYKDIDKKYESETVAKLFYINPKKDLSNLHLGGDIRVDDLWSAGSNLTLKVPSIQNISFDASVKLPHPNFEIHSAKGDLTFTLPIEKAMYMVKYNTLRTKKHYGSDGSYIFLKNQNNTSLKTHFTVIWDIKKAIKNVLEYNKKQFAHSIEYQMASPAYTDKNAIVAKASYKPNEDYHFVSGEIFRPEGVYLGFGNVNFKEFANMNGVVNVTIPYDNYKYAGLTFATETSDKIYNRLLKGFWANDFAILDGKCDITKGPSPNDLKRNGSIIIELPLNSRHLLNVNYLYEEKFPLSKGNATVMYNGLDFLDADYTCKSEVSSGYNKDDTHVELKNKFLPLAANYIHVKEFDTDPLNIAVFTDKKHVQLYHLENQTKFDIEGDLRLFSNTTGQKFEVEARQSNKTVKFRSEYEIKEKIFHQNSRLDFGATAWIEYYLTLFNQSDELFDSQKAMLEVNYPQRQFTTTGSYKIAENVIYTNCYIKMDPENKSVEAGLDWKKISANKEQFLLTFRHPTFEKNVTILSEYDYDANNLLNANMKIDYSTDPEQLFILGGHLNDNSKLGEYNYSYFVYVNHNATKLDLKATGDLFWGSDVYSTLHLREYKRSYLPLQTAEYLAKLDFITNQIELKKDSLGQLSYLKAMSESKHPLYTGDLILTHDYNTATGNYNLDWDKKLFFLEHNMTSDGKQSLHMYGDIPDARSANFLVYRDYEDIRISDVTYHLKMNHSRLFISNLVWRPDLFKNIQSLVYQGVHDLYNYITGTINDTKQYVRSEIKESLQGIWQEAEPKVEYFIEDLRYLRIIESDFEEFKVFLNNSYQNNDFYIKTTLTVTMYAFEQLALKKHFESVPAIVSEIWNIMGDSGLKVKKSVDWVFERLRTYYTKLNAFVKELLNGDPIQLLSDAFSNMLKQYDDFVRKLHVAFIQYIERLWNNMYTLVVDNWYKMLIAVEPTFLKLVHYCEAIAWSTSKEFLDFLYLRKSELVGSPYFVKFTNFTHDMDRFYKDITGNNTISSVIKYSKVGYNFLKERYLDKLPFGKELEAVVNEIIHEINQLRKIPAIAFVEQRLNRIYNRLVWFYNYFHIESRLQTFLRILHTKLTDVSQTALQAENRYRVAKTKFIFEPGDGVMYLEQKLPMSWHAFNETPQFQEIPEIKFIYDIQKFFRSSQKSFWNFYYNYKPYTNPSEWFPPFKAEAIIVGNKYYVTFDKKIISFKGKCSYLLSNDFKNHNFSLVMSYNDNSETPDLLLFINKTVIEINIFRDEVKIQGTPSSHLPLQIGSTYIYRNTDVITATSQNDFTLECNTNFKVCTFEISGWYFGKTAGLLGTFNNEPYDDLLSSNGTKLKRDGITDFVESWKLDKNCNHSIITINDEQNTDVIQLCKEIFDTKMSDFSTCFPIVDEKPFLKMCLNSLSFEEACSSAMAYSTLCSYENTPLTIPENCVRCKLPNRESISEGEYVKFGKHNISRTSDVVFLIKAMECNRNLTKPKNIMILLESIENELNKAQITNNRYATILFGGDGIYEEPRVLTSSGKIFNNFSTFSKSFENIPLGTGNTSDIFSAFTYASRLNFRPAVVKNFILLSCAECQDHSMKFDYPILHQLLSESAITLHILMTEDFALQKNRESKIVYGIDSRKAYTKKDVQSLKGDRSLRLHVKLPKSTMGLCIALSLETNGTLFSTKPLINGNAEIKQKFSTVFAKRLAESSKPAKHVYCECTTSSSGSPVMECYPSDIPSRASMDYGFDEYELLANLQPGEKLR